MGFVNLLNYSMIILQTDHTSDLLKISWPQNTENLLHIF